MEFTTSLQLLLSFFFMSLIGGTVLLAFFINEKKGWVMSSFVFILGTILILVLSKQCSTATIITCYPGGDTKIAEYLFKYCDSIGNEYEIENDGTYVFYDGLGEIGIHSTCELTVFPIVYTSEHAKVGSPVDRQVERIALEPYNLQRINHAINYPFKGVPNKRDTFDSFGKEEEVWSINYTDNIGVDFVPLYHELIYMSPDTY